MFIKSEKIYDAAVIGAGLAGAAVARKLACSGLKTLLIDKESGVGGGASGNMIGLATPYYSDARIQATEFYREGFTRLQQFFNDHQLHEKENGEVFFKKTGVVQLPVTNRQKRLVVNEHAPAGEGIDLKVIDKATATTLVGAEIQESCLYFPEALTVNPLYFCRVLIHDAKQNGAEIFFTHQIKGYEVHNDLWYLFDERNQRICKAKILVVCTASDNHLLQKDLCFLKIEPVKGQIVYIDHNLFPFTLRMPVSFGGYLVPGLSFAPEREQRLNHKFETVCFGATYEHDFDNMDFNQVLQKKLENKAKHHLPELSELFTKQEYMKYYRVSVRASTPDKMPYIGRVAADRFGKARCYFSVGHGSKGILSSIIGADIIVECISERNRVISDGVKRAVDPMRFFEKGSK
jgi:tRNA 5-methylaminomethyl-2-thiouridine biosynthesis bifunctional protein